LWVEGESEAGYAYAELEGSFDKPVEILMLEVVALVLRGGDLQKRFMIIIGLLLMKY